NEDLDSRSNSVQEGGDDSNPLRPINVDDLVGLGGAITRARAKKAQGTLDQLVLNIQAATGPSDSTRPITCLIFEDMSLEGYGQARETKGMACLLTQTQ
ncbi:hypothetical protein Lal_00043536, partial [Lupinus albus]